MMKKNLNYMYLGTPLNVKYKRSGCSLEKTTKFCTQVTENYIFYHRELQYFIRPHSTGTCSILQGDTLYR